jgi:hypothetical protein
VTGVEFRIARTARIAMPDAGTSRRVPRLRTSCIAARCVATPSRRSPCGPPQTANDLVAIELIHELQHRAIDQASVLTTVPAKGHGGTRGIRRGFVASVYVEDVEPKQYLRAKTDGTPAGSWPLKSCCCCGWPIRTRVHALR